MNSGLQIDCPYSAEEIQYIFNTGAIADINILVCFENHKRLFRCHKFLLALASTYFKKMFSNNRKRYRGNENKTIKISDIHPDVFKLILHYIYTDEIIIESLDIAYQLCIHARKYSLFLLSNECMKFIHRALKPSNACKTLEFARMFQKFDLMQSSLNMIVNNTRCVINEPSFINIDFSTLMLILDQEELAIQSEIDLFNAIMRFAELNDIINATHPMISMRSADFHNHMYYDPNEEYQNESTQSFITNNQSNDDVDAMERFFQNRYLLKQAFMKLRFLTLTPTQFAEGPGCLKIIPEKELMAILMHILCPGIEDYPLPEFCCKNRAPRIMLQ